MGKTIIKNDVTNATKYFFDLEDNITITLEQMAEFINGVLDNRGFLLKEKNDCVKQVYFLELGAYHFIWFHFVGVVLLKNVVTK